VLARLLSTLLVLFAVFAGTRAMVRGLPGDPVDALLSESGTSIPREELRREMGLDQPFFPALLQDARHAMHGDFGKSLFSKQPIGPLIRGRFLNTLYLSLVSLAIALGMSLWIGLRAAENPGSLADRFCTFFGAVTAALPTPWIGPMLIVVFAVWLPIFPLGESVLLPAITLSLGLSGIWSRLIRNRVTDSLTTGAAQSARARGLPEWRVTLKYGLGPVSGVLIAYLGSQIGLLLGGAVVTEVIFNWQGLGSLWVTAVLRRDYPLIEAATFVTAATTLTGIWFGDALRSLIDRRQERLR
jgi:ABC-type dipeptide/oligopeptide/nickel transport system permease component